jgi:hypothetical protein
MGNWIKAAPPQVRKCLIFPLVILSLCAGIQKEAEASPHSVVFVVDSSAAMAPYMDGVKDTILSYVEQAERNDYLGVVSYSSSAKMLAMKKITGPSDRKTFEIMLAALTAQGDSADIDGGVERALEEVATLKRRGDKNVKGIIIISASALPEDRSIEGLEGTLQEVSTLVQEDEWYIQYCFLSGAKDSRVASFVAENKGFSYDLDALCKKNGTEIIAELYQIAIIPEKSCKIIAADMRGAALKKSLTTNEEWNPFKPGEAIEEGFRLNSAEDSRFTLAVEHFGKIGFAPSTEIVLERIRRNPVSGRTDVDIRFESGSAWVHISENSATLHATYMESSAEISGSVDAALRTTASGDLEITSLSGGMAVKSAGTATAPITVGQNQTTYAKAGRVLTASAPAEARLVEEWKDWNKVLVNNVPLATVAFAIPELIFPAGPVVVGPLVSGKEMRQSLPVRLMNVPEKSKLDVSVDLLVPLPDGISWSSVLLDGEKPDLKQLELKFDGSGGFKSGFKEEHKGFMTVSPAPDSTIKFEKISVPLVIITKKNLLSTTVLLLGVVAVCLGAAGFAAARLYRKKEIVRPRPHRVIGRLIVIDDPTKGRTGSVNLEDISTKSSRLSLVIGRDRAAEIRLKHTSVQPTHCLIEAHLLGDHLVAYIEPMGSGEVTINGDRIKSRTRLEDVDRIGIGAFSFQFEDSQFYKKVDVVYSNGRRIAGVLDASGMDAEGFKISPMDAVSPSERARIKFSDIRSVIFHRRTADILAQKPRPQVKHAAMKRVELMFKRGDTISGYVQREYTEGRQRFVELLPLEPSSEIDYTIVEYSAVVEKKTV